MPSAATQILVCVLSFIFAFSSLPVAQEGNAGHQSVQVQPSSLSCLAPSVQAKKTLTVAFNPKRDFLNFSTLLPRGSYDMKDVPLTVVFNFVETAFSSGLAVLNSCAGGALQKTLSLDANVNPAAYINVALAFIMFTQNDKGYEAAGDISASAIARWISVMTGDPTGQKVKVYEYDISRSKDAERFEVLTQRLLRGVYLYGDGRHWSVDRSELAGTMRYVFADPDFISRHYGINLQFPMNEKDTRKLYGAGLSRQIQNQKERNTIIFFWVIVVAGGIISAAIFGPSIIDSMLQNLKETNAPLYDFIIPYFSQSDKSNFINQSGFGFGVFIIGFQNIIDKALSPFQSKSAVERERRRNKTGVLFGSPKFRKNNKKDFEQVILEAGKQGIVLPATGVKRELWELHGQPSVTRNGAEVPEQFMLPAYEPVFDERTDAFLYWKKCSSPVPNIFYVRDAEENGQEEISVVSQADMDINRGTIIDARQKGVILPERGIEKNAWDLSKTRWICQDGAKHLNEETLAAYVPVFDTVTGDFRYWQYSEQVSNPFFVNLLVANKSGRAGIMAVVEKALPGNAGASKAKRLGGEDAWGLRQTDAYQHSAVMIAA